MTGYRAHFRTTRNIRRRDLCGAVARRMSKLDARQAAWAWHELSIHIEQLELKDIPKFWDLLFAMRACTFFGRKASGIPLEKS
jgi:hypothetical protein